MQTYRLTLSADNQPSPATFGEKRARAPSDPLTGWALAVTLSCCFLAVLWTTPINHDTAWYLVATEAWLKGAVLYEDIVEVNPPLNFYLTVPSVLLAEATGVSPDRAQLLVTTALLAGCLGWCWHLLPPLGLLRRGLLLVCLAAALVLPFLADVAQREHVMLLFMTPWVIGKLTGAGTGHAARAGVAALGLCLKPFFMLYPLALTGHAMMTKRSIRPAFATDNLVFLSAGAGYVAAVAALHPQYFTDIVPVARHVYGEYGLNTASVLLRFGSPGLALGLLLVLAMAARSKAAPLGQLSLLIGAAIVIYLVQWTGYGYQFFPIVSFVMLGLGWMLCVPGSARGGAIPAMALLALALLAYQAVTRGPYFSVVTEVLSLELAELDRGTRLMAFSTSLNPGSPVALRNDLEWTSRYPALWLVPGVVDGLAATDCSADPDRCAALSAIEARTRADTVNDMILRRPDILIFDHTHDYIDTPGFSWNGFFRADPRWASVIAEFEIVRDTRDYDIYLHRRLTQD